MDDKEEEREEKRRLRDERFVEKTGEKRTVLEERRREGEKQREKIRGEEREREERRGKDKTELLELHGDGLGLGVARSCKWQLMWTHLLYFKQVYNTLQ